MSKEQKNFQFKDLPPHLQKKYKHSIIFQKEHHIQSNTFDFDLQKLHQRKVEKEKTIEEKLELFQINSTELKYLISVFKMLSAPHNLKYFTKEELADVLKKMEVKMSKSDIERMIWEFDEDLNKKITEKEFINMYKKCTIDKTGAESKNLFHLTQFLMYCKPLCFKITVEDTLELLFVRAKLEAEKNNQRCDEKEIIGKLEEQILVIFSGEEKTAEGVETEIRFEEYLQRINKRAIEKRRKEIEVAKSVLKYGSKVHDF